MMVYYNPYLTGYYNPLYNPTNQGFFKWIVFKKTAVSKAGGGGRQAWEAN